MKKFFTVTEANSALQLVRPIVHDILTKMREAETLHNEVKMEKEHGTVHETSLLAKISRAEELLDQIEYHMKELENIGVELKDLKRGIVDFPCMHEGRIVYLCWMLEENSVCFWHEITGSYFQRKPIVQTEQLV